MNKLFSRIAEYFKDLWALFCYKAILLFYGDKNNELSNMSDEEYCKACDCYIIDAYFDDEDDARNGITYYADQDAAWSTFDFKVKAFLPSLGIEAPSIVTKKSLEEAFEGREETIDVSYIVLWEDYVNRYVKIWDKNHDHVIASWSVLPAIR